MGPWGPVASRTTACFWIAAFRLSSRIKATEERESLFGCLVVFPGHTTRRCCVVPESAESDRGRFCCIDSQLNAAPPLHLPPSHPDSILPPTDTKDTVISSVHPIPTRAPTYSATPSPLRMPSPTRPGRHIPGNRTGKCQWVSICGRGTHASPAKSLLQ